MDWSQIIVGVLAMCGTLGGSYLGLRKNNSIVELRLNRLEQKVDLHNNAVQRLIKAEGELSRHEGRIKELESLHPRRKEE